MVLSQASCVARDGNGSASCKASALTPILSLTERENFKSLQDVMFKGLGMEEQ